MKRLQLTALIALVVVVVGLHTGTTPRRPAAATTTAAGATTTAANPPPRRRVRPPTVSLVQGTDLTFHMVTHSDDGVFWSVVKKGAEDAAAALGVTHGLEPLQQQWGKAGAGHRSCRSPQGPMALACRWQTRPLSNPPCWPPSRPESRSSPSTPAWTSTRNWAP